MSRDPFLTALHLGWLAGLAPAVMRFERARRSARRTQSEKLRRLLQQNRHTAFGHTSRFSSISSFEEYRRAVPIRTYDELEPWLARAQRGERGVLTAEPIRFFERSGGTSRGATKLLPYTATMLGELQAATNPWLADLYRRHPELVGRPAYWSLSPVAQGERVTEGGVPIGIDDDTGYFGPLRRYVLGRSMAVPGEVARAPDMARWRLETLVHLVRCRTLGFVSVWSPTFLTVLVDALVADPDPVLAHAALPSERRREVALALGGPRAGLGSRLWPELGVISCWADGVSERPARGLMELFPRARLEGKGLLATEGVVTIPWGPDRLPTLALTSHVLEFLPADRAEKRQTVLPEALEVGREYLPVLTSGAGLYRYLLEDVVRCVGPLALRFVGKRDLVGDLVGEKLDGRAVTAIVEHALTLQGASGTPWLFTPRPDARGYGLLIDAAPELALDALAAQVEVALREGHAYRYARELCQLEAVTVGQVAHLEARLLAEAVAQGQRLGDVKPLRFDPRPRWGRLFASPEGLAEPGCPTGFASAEGLAEPGCPTGFAAPDPTHTGGLFR